MRRIALLLLTLGLVLTIAAPAYAQAARARLIGTASDPDGAPLPGVIVTVTNEANGQVRTTVTGATGRYTFNGLPAATYTVMFELQGFQTDEKTGMRVLVGSVPEMNSTMQISGVAETVTVTGIAPIIETTSKQVGGNVTAELFTTLPTQNRSFVMFAALMPGVIGNPSSESTASDSLFINGQDDNNNSFNIDGADNSDDVIGARAGAQTRTAIEAIQEFQIITTQFDAEFGRTQGGVLNAITKSGGNSFRGSGFFYYQDSSLNSKNFFTERQGAEQPDFTVSSLGGTLGGPILKDRLFFFGSIERTKPNEGVSRTFNTRPDLDFATTEDNLLENILVKTDWQLAADHKFAFRYLREYSPQVNQIIGGRTTLEASREEDDTDTGWVATLDSVVGDSAFNNLRISNTREDVSFANPGYNNNGQNFAAQRALAVSQSRPTVLEGANTVAQSRINDSLQFDNTFSYFLPDWGGDHNFRFGAQYSRRLEEFFNSGTANGRFNFDVDRPFVASDLSTYPESFSVRINGETTAHIPTNKVFGAFFQDDWTISRKLTLNLGLRYDRETIVPGDNNNLAPRLGFAWDPRGDGKTVVRGGWGRFYERFQLGAFSRYFLDGIVDTGGFVTRVPGSGSDQALFWAIAQANGITSIQQLADYLIADLEGGGAGINDRPTVENPDLRSPFADTFSIGAEHQITNDVAIGVDFIHTENKNTHISVDLNPFSTSQGGRPNISIFNGEQVTLGSVGSLVNAGNTTYNALQFSIRRRFTDSAIGRFQGQISYTYAKQNGNAPAGQGSSRFQSRTETGYNFDTGQFIGEDPQLNLNVPQNIDQPSSWHRNNNLVMNWSWYIPGTTWGSRSNGLMFSGVFRYMDGSRYTLQEFARLDNNNRQIAAAGTHSANSDSDIAQDAIDFNGRTNGAEQPNFTRLDLSLRYRIPIRGFSATVSFDVFNLTNRVNFSNAGSSFVTSGSFLVPSRAFQPREFQLGIRADF